MKYTFVRAATWTLSMMLSLTLMVGCGGEKAGGKQAPEKSTTNAGNDGKPDKTVSDANTGPAAEAVKEVLEHLFEIVREGDFSQAAEFLMYRGDDASRGDAACRGDAVSSVRRLFTMITWSRLDVGVVRAASAETTPGSSS
ncbi:MAG: hypothetical protein AAF570_20840, partial [Bacteroidota bacterium]